MDDFRGDLCWCQGYKGQELHFVSGDTVCHICGNSVKFHSESGHVRDFQHSLRNLAQLATQPHTGIFGIAESGVLKPRIRIHAFPDCKQLGEDLEGAGELEIAAIAFSSSEFLYAMSGLPDFQLSLWNFREPQLLATLQLPEVSPTQLSVSPMNWRLVAALHGTKVAVAEAERCDGLFRLTVSSLRLPPVDSETDAVTECQTAKSRVSTRSSTAEKSRGLLELPESAMAGLQPEFAKEFEEFKDERAVVRMRGRCVAWSELERDFFVGCEDGGLVRYDGERKLARVMRAVQPPTRPSTANAIAEVDEEAGEDAVETPRQAARDETVGLDRLCLASVGLIAAGGDGCLRLLRLGQESRLTGVDELAAFDHPVEALACRGDRLAVGIGDGSVALLSVGEGAAEPQAKVAYDGGAGGFVGAAVMPPGDSVVATARSTGLVQLWETREQKGVGTGQLLGQLSLSLECTAFAASPSANVVFVGAEDGSVSVVDFTKPKEPKVIARLFLHANSPVTRMALDAEGEFLATAADDGSVFVSSGLPSSGFRVLGCIRVPGQVRDLAMAGAAGQGGVQLAAIVQLPDERSPSRITFVNLGSQLLAEPENFYGHQRGIFDDSAVKRQNFRLDSGAFGCALFAGAQNWFYAVSHSTRQLLKYKVPTAESEVEEEDPILSADVDGSPEIFFDEPEQQLRLSSSGGLLLGFGADGEVVIVDVLAKCELGRLQAHSFTSGGILSACMAEDASFVATAGQDGSLCRFNIRLPASVSSRQQQWHLERSSNAMSTTQEENAAAAAASSWTPPPIRKRRQSTSSDDSDEADAGRQPTWLSEQETQTLIEEDAKFADRKRELRDKLGRMREQIRDMVDANADENDLERLDPHEFELDLDEQARLAQETEAEVSSVRKRIDLDNLAKQYLADVIKRDCWEAMEVKGRSIRSFVSKIEVSNYPLRPVDSGQAARLRQVNKRRHVETSEAKDRRLMLDSTSKEQQAEGEEEEEIKEEIHESDTLQGSTSEGIDETAERFGVATTSFYSQFDLQTREQKVNQIVMLEDAIRQVKSGFNKKFDEVFKKKEQEMSKIRERNQRVKKIVSDLGLNTKVSDPSFEPTERPELLFVVKDEEVTVEKYLTPEQRKKLEEERLAEEERLRRERLDNWRERGLDQMMGGVLEVKKEDELKKDIPKPAFMLNKAEADWSEDERKAAEDYDRRVKELEEEREKYKKQLEAELKKLQALTEENMSTFDQELRELFVKKIKTQAAVVQEELKICRLRLAMLVEEEFGCRQRELLFLIDRKKAELQVLGPLIDKCRKLVKDHDDGIQNARLENEYLEKNFSAFKREFPDASTVIVEQLHKMFKKKMPQLKLPKAADALSPYTARPTTASKQEGTRRALSSLLDEQDDERHMPAGTEPQVWQKFCEIRRRKRQTEVEISARLVAQSEFSEFATQREKEYNDLQMDVENLKLLLEQLNNQKAQFVNNLEVQLLVRQGQVEVEPKDDFIIDFADTLLLHRNVVEELNTKIKALGDAKVKFMEEAKDSKKRFRNLEWDLRGMRMEAEDLINRISDINSFKITREIQRYLAADDYDGLISSEIQKLDQAIELMKKHHQKMIAMKETRLRELSEGKAGALDAKNSALDGELKEMNVAVNERLHIDEVNAEKRDESQAAKKRYEQILQRQRLVDLAKAQAKEVAVLRAEVERLRMRTFPALVHNK